MKRFLFCIAALVSASLPLSTHAGGPSVSVVVGADAPALERLAADELAAQFEQLFEAEVTVATAADDGAVNVILVGSPTTNPQIDAAVWPAELSDQGQVLKTVSDDGKSQLVVGGGSPVATLWAAYELGHSFGMRYLLHEDFAPIDAPQFSLAGFDTVLEPNVKVRAWRTIDSNAAGQESWGLADHQKLLKQLAKLKFNRVTLVIHPWQPFYDVDSGDSPKTDGQLWHGREFDVSGDTAGRSVFEGAKVFQNPDFAGAETDAERVVAAGKLVEGIKAAAKQLGIAVTFETNEKRDDAVEILSLGQDSGGVLPQFSTSKLPQRLAAIRADQTRQGFAVKCWIPGDLNADVYYLSRASFDAELMPADTLDSLVTPICGEGVAERLATGFAAIEEVTALIEKEDPNFAVPDPMMFMEHFESSEPAPEWWAKAKELYGTAVNEMYRANTRARGGARPFILYHAKYFTFALHYMGAVEAARAAGIARAGNKDEGWMEDLELAVESMHSALDIYSDVARDNSDRGVIAVLNKYAYRPLIEALNDAPLP